jgi:hypothetical protein
MDDTVLLGFLKVIGISMVPVALMGALLHARQGWEAAQRLLRRAGVSAPEEPVATGPPLERLAADLRRLRPLVVHPPQGVPMARHRGTVAAYDEVLVRTARALSVPTTLAELPEQGLDREAERLRVEHALEAAGLRWDLRRT